MPKAATLLPMNVAFRKPGMTREAFLIWAERQRVRYEFDGFQPVAMVGGTQRHNRIGVNACSALLTRLRGSPCQAFGMDAGVATIGDAVRYPDALVTCAPGPGDNKLIPGVVVIFEVSSPSSSVTDHTTKLREYAAVPTIRHYVILEQEIIAGTLYERPDGESPWTATPLVAGNALRLSAIGIEIPLDDFYENVRWSERDEEAAFAAADEGSTPTRRDAQPADQ